MSAAQRNRFLVQVIRNCLIMAFLDMEIAFFQV